MAPPVPPTTVRTAWLYKGQILVAVLRAEPGEVTPTVEGTDDAVPCAYAAGQCLSTEWEPDVRKGLADCHSFDELLKRMKYFKYRVDTAGPQFRRRRFYRL
ncbi:MAG: hypothetical protein HY904_18680 [Deltaproteobacteria bacterium]|nr:hypothetical protein [Deltaproteobacteria bacterium]